MAMLPYKRADRVAELLREEISRILAEEVKDPGIGMVTITRVRLTDDLRYARVYFSVMGGSEKREQSLSGLNRAKQFIRAEIRAHTDLRYTPEVEFLYDDSLDYSERIEALIAEIHRSEDKRAS